MLEDTIDPLILTEFFQSGSVNARNVVVQVRTDVKVTLQGKRVVWPA